MSIMSNYLERPIEKRLAYVRGKARDLLTSTRLSLEIRNTRNPEWDDDPLLERVALAFAAHAELSEQDPPKNMAPYVNVKITEAGENIVDLIYLVGVIRILPSYWSQDAKKYCALRPQSGKFNYMLGVHVERMEIVVAASETDIIPSEDDPQKEDKPFIAFRGLDEYLSFFDDVREAHRALETVRSYPEWVWPVYVAMWRFEQEVARLEHVDLSSTGLGRPQHRAGTELVALLPQPSRKLRETAVASALQQPVYAFNHHRWSLPEYSPQTAGSSDVSAKAKDVVKKLASELGIELDTAEASLSATNQSLLVVNRLLSRE